MPGRLDRGHTPSNTSTISKATARRELTWLDISAPVPLGSGWSAGKTGVVSCGAPGTLCRVNTTPAEQYSSRCGKSKPSRVPPVFCLWPRLARCPSDASLDVISWRPFLGRSLLPLPTIADHCRSMFCFFYIFEMFWDDYPNVVG